MRRRVALFLTGVAVLAGCGQTSVDSSTTTTSTGVIVTGPATTQAEVGATQAEMVAVLWGRDSSGNVTSVFPTDDDVANSFSIVENKQRTYKATVTRDEMAAPEEAVGQASRSQGGGTWVKTWEVSSEDELGGGRVLLWVSVLPPNGDTGRVETAARTVVPAGHEVVSVVPGAPKDSWGARWAEANSSGVWAYVDAKNGSVHVSCLVEGRVVTMENLCGGVTRYILEATNGKSL